MRIEEKNVLHNKKKASKVDQIVKKKPGKKLKVAKKEKIPRVKKR
jgi:hypothetical protein